MFHALEQALEAALSGRPEGARLLITHIGAGAGELMPLWISLQPSSLLLVEGDPGVANALEQVCAAVANCEVLSLAVSATAGTSAWHRYGHSALNGFVEMSALRRVYPRLRFLETVPQAHVPVAQIISQANSTQQSIIQAGDTAWHVLVLDVPGQEDALLASLQAAQLDSWDVVIICGCGALPVPLAAPAAVQRLQGAGAQIAWTNADLEHLWPVSVLASKRSDGVATLNRSSPPSVQFTPLGETASPDLLGGASHERAEDLREIKHLRAAEASLREELKALHEAHSRERARHDALQQQLADAEAQISLLKDVLFREVHR